MLCTGNVHTSFSFHFGVRVNFCRFYVFLPDFAAIQKFLIHCNISLLIHNTQNFYHRKHNAVIISLMRIGKVFSIRHYI